MYEQAFRAMGCSMLALIDSSEPCAAELVQQAPAWFEAWEQALSRFRSSSELTQLNAAGRLSPVSPVLWDVAEAAVWAAAYTDGLVTPLGLEALELAGYTHSFDLGLDAAPVPARRAVIPEWTAIGRNVATHTIELPAGARLDLGGVAKGWAAAEAVQRLASAGPALVDAGGDIAVSGPMADGSAWPVAIDDPRHPEQSLGMLMLTRGAVATSGRDYRRWRQGERERHHLIDPRTGEPALTDVLTATVVAPDAVLAEAAAKAVLIQGSESGLAWIEARPSLAAMLVLDDGRMLASRRLNELLY